MGPHAEPGVPLSAERMVCGDGSGSKSIMRPANWQALGACKIKPIIYTAFALSFLPFSVAQAQLAITEVMSSGQSPDYLELTNFGTNTVALSGYTIQDPTSEHLAIPGEGLLIKPQESIVFFRTNRVGWPTEADFRSMWGLRPDEPVLRAFERPGFSSGGDSLLLFDAIGDLVDQVTFGPATFGYSFAYDATTGVFGALSEAGVCGAWRTAQTLDVGSPGTTCGPVPLQITNQPTNLVATAGLDVAFYVGAGGMPQPRYQWRFEGEPLPGATASVLWITNAQPPNAGVYDVLLWNGLEVLLSDPATLTVDTNRCRPAIVNPSKGCTVFVGQTAKFTATVSGYPLPALQWFVNGTAIPSETQLTLLVPNCQLEMSGWIYCLQATNELGSASACAKLIVTNKPDLRITEVMARRHVDARPHKDWFKVTSYDTNRVNLLGYRFVCTQNRSFAGAQVIKEPVVIKPGESVIFADVILADALTRNEFVAWWGADNLPSDLQVIPYTGFGISPDIPEFVYLWNPAAEDPDDAVAQVFTSGTFLDGISQFFDFEGCPTGCDSIAGERGAFYANSGGDIGAPGYDSVPKLGFLSCEGITQKDGQVWLKGRAVVGKTYLLLYKDNLLDEYWQPLLPVQTATNATVIFQDGPLREKRFYWFYQTNEMPSGM